MTEHRKPFDWDAYEKKMDAELSQARLQNMIADGQLIIRERRDRYIRAALQGLLSKYGNEDSRGSVMPAEMLAHVAAEYADAAIAEADKVKP
jgi:hypothetical protein